jgi:hypothetical protein
MNCLKNGWRSGFVGKFVRLCQNFVFSQWSAFVSVFVASSVYKKQIPQGEI